MPETKKVGKQKITTYYKEPSSKFLQHHKERVADNRAKRDAATSKPSTGKRILTAIGDFNRAIAPHIEQGKRTGGKVQRYAASRSHAIDHNLVRGQFNPMTAGQNWMNMSFPGSGFGQPAAAPRRPAAPAPRRKRRKPRQRQDDDSWGWGMGMPRY